MYTLRSLTPRLLAGFGTLTLLAGIGLIASRPARTAGGPVPVTVANSSLNVQNRDADNPAREPVQFSLSPHSNVSGSASSPFVVPAGKQLVIEYINGSFNQLTLNTFGEVSVFTTAGGHFGSYRLVTRAASSTPFNQVVRIYADPGTAVIVGINAFNSDGSLAAACNGSASISGYYVDVP